MFWEPIIEAFSAAIDALGNFIDGMLGGGRPR